MWPAFWRCRPSHAAQIAYMMYLYRLYLVLYIRFFFTDWQLMIDEQIWKPSKGLKAGVIHPAMAALLKSCSTLVMAKLENEGWPYYRWFTVILWDETKLPHDFPSSRVEGYGKLSEKFWDDCAEALFHRGQVTRLHPIQLYIWAQRNWKLESCFHFHPRPI